MSFIAVIPARYASTRLPGKPLLDIAGKPMVVRVAERVRASGASALWVATDHADIRAVCAEHDVPCLMTRCDHPSGTDRLAEVAQQLACGDRDILVNVQGDEPLLEPSLIDLVAEELGRDRDAAIATVAHPIQDAADFFNPNVVKVVSDQQGRALYFSRAPIPYARDAFSEDLSVLPLELNALRHVGLYAYRSSFLKHYAALAPAPLERVEALEQLRALWHGYSIRVAVVQHAPAAGVDTPEDLERVRRVFGNCMA